MEQVQAISPRTGPFEMIGSGGLSRLDFYRHELSTPVQHHIDFMAPAVLTRANNHYYLELPG